jgi:glutamine---fructose-6-phosphate transaminase (isomerizing)
MCGIFGINLKEKLKNNQFNNLKKDINFFSNLSQIRGSDTFGILLSSADQNHVYKIATEPKKAVKTISFKKFIDKSLNSIARLNENNFNLIGQTRLVTNGSKSVDINNQPIISKEIIGVHNGIIISNNDVKSTKTQNYEGYKIKSDSLELYENLSNFINEGKNFYNDYLNYLKNIRGNYSVAFRIPSLLKTIISSNCGSLYYFNNDKILIYSSEKSFLLRFLKKSKILKKYSNNNYNIEKILNWSLVYDEISGKIEKLFHDKSEKKEIIKKTKFKVFDNLSDNHRRFKNLKRCSNCILPETYPFIFFDETGKCNYCNNYVKQKFKGEDELLRYLDKFRSKDGSPDCLIGLSGGRDSSYGLHLIKKKYGMNPIAYTYDWGLTTDISRINCSKLCGKLGVEHIIRSANIKQKREYVRKNIMAWLKKPHLGMVPIIHAGDKPNLDYGRILSKELNLKLVVHFTGYQVEQREFFLGFTGVKQTLRNNQRMSSYGNLNKIKMFLFYSSQFLFNPHYINSALWDNFSGYLNAFIKKENFLHFFNYIKWDEDEMINVLNKEYDWEADISYGKNQWRMGDGQTAFINYIYYTLAGFSEFDNFRSNQVCEGLISRKEAIKLAEQDNHIRYDSLKNFSEIIGFNLDEVLAQINSFEKKY